mmetsp:Transcript_131105/g.327096  ORF Transcript_131105/g.327096 Transcript_131105/m.327096 type:complete len:257 (+) Transcript_131105:112-882(+)
MTEELGTSGSLQFAARLAIAVVLLTAAAIAFGFLAGAWSARRAAARKRREGQTVHTATAGTGRRRRDELCECGVMLPKSCSPEEKLRHQASNRHKSNMLKLGNASEVIVCEEVSEYRAAAQFLVKPNDNVLEVGCHVGGTTKVLAGLCQKLIGVDQQADLVAQARIKLPEVQFEILDAFDASKVLALTRQVTPARFHKVFIDISGSRDIATVVRLMDMYENTLKPEVMVVKSQALKRLLLRSQLWIHHPGGAKGEP